MKIWKFLARRATDPWALDKVIRGISPDVDISHDNPYAEKVAAQMAGDGRALNWAHGVTVRLPASFAGWGI